MDHYLSSQDVDLLENPTKRPTEVEAARRATFARINERRNARLRASAQPVVTATAQPLTPTLVINRANRGVKAVLSPQHATYILVSAAFQDAQEKISTLHEPSQSYRGPFSALWSLLLSRFFREDRNQYTSFDAAIFAAIVESRLNGEEGRIGAITKDNPNLRKYIHWRNSELKYNSMRGGLNKSI